MEIKLCYWRMYIITTKGLDKYIYSVIVQYESSRQNQTGGNPLHITVKKEFGYKRKSGLHKPPTNWQQKTWCANFKLFFAPAWIFPIANTISNTADDFFHIVCTSITITKMWTKSLELVVHLKKDSNKKVQKYPCPLCRSASMTSDDLLSWH